MAFVKSAAISSNDLQETITVTASHYQFFSLQIWQLLHIIIALSVPEETRDSFVNEFAALFLFLR